MKTLVQRLSWPRSQPHRLLIIIVLLRITIMSTHVKRQKAIAVERMTHPSRSSLGSVSPGSPAQFPADCHERRRSKCRSNNIIRSRYVISPFDSAAEIAEATRSSPVINAIISSIDLFPERWATSIIRIFNASLVPKSIHVLQKYD